MSTPRAVLLYLVIVAAICVTTPAFWAIVDMRVGASPVVYQNHDGSLQPATIGPKSHWPAWAIVPEGADLRVKHWFGSSALAKASGMGELKLAGEARAAAAAFAARLRVDGWEIEMGRFESVLPGMPPRAMVRCRVRATKDDRLLIASFEAKPAMGTGHLSWADAPAPGLWLAPHGLVKGEC